MIRVLPVIPPDLRPLVPLEGAGSRPDLNDLIAESSTATTA